MEQRQRFRQGVKQQYSQYPLICTGTSLEMNKQNQQPILLHFVKPSQQGSQKNLNKRRLSASKLFQHIQKEIENNKQLLAQKNKNIYQRIQEALDKKHIGNGGPTAYDTGFRPPTPIATIGVGIGIGTKPKRCWSGGWKGRAVSSVDKANGVINQQKNQRMSSKVMPNTSKQFQQNPPQAASSNAPQSNQATIHPTSNMLTTTNPSIPTNPSILNPQNPPNKLNPPYPYPSYTFDDHAVRRPQTPHRPKTGLSKSGSKLQRQSIQRCSKIFSSVGEGGEGGSEQVVMEVVGVASSKSRRNMKVLNPKKQKKIHYPSNKNRNLKTQPSFFSPKKPTRPTSIPNNSHLHPGTSYLQPGTSYLQPGISYLQPGPQPGTSYLQPAPYLQPSPNPALTGTLPKKRKISTKQSLTNRFSDIITHCDNEQMEIVEIGQKIGYFQYFWKKVDNQRSVMNDFCRLVDKMKVAMADLED